MGVSAAALWGAITTGVGTAAAGAGAAVSGATAGLGAGVSSALGAAASGAVTGGAIGAGSALVTGDSVLKGLERGAVSGGVTGGVSNALAPGLEKVTGLGGRASSALAGALGGAVGAELTGGNPLTGAVTGGAQSYFSAPKASASPTAAAPVGGGGSSSAASLAAPAGVGDLGPGAGILPSNFDVANDPLFSSANSGPTGGGGLPGNVGAGAAAPSGVSQSGAGTPGTFLSKVADNAPLLFLGASALKGNKPAPYSDTLGGDASAMAAQGQQMMDYLSSGALPPGIQHGLDAQAENARATVRSDYAARGMSGSSAERQDLASIGQRTAATGHDLAIQLFNSGLGETQAADSLYAHLMGVQMQEDQGLSDAVGNLAAWMAQAA